MMLHRPPRAFNDTLPPNGSANDKRIELTAAYLPNQKGRLEVLAHCGKHFRFIPQADVKAGVLAHCPLVNCQETKTCKACGCEKPQVEFALSKNDCRATRCKSCVNAQHAAKR